MSPLMLASAIGPRGAKRFTRTTGRNLGDLDTAKRLLGGRSWSELSREDKLSIRENTGWQLGPGGDWLYETNTDPTLTPAFKERFGPWLTADKNVSTALQSLRDTVASLKAEESAVAKSWNERNPSSPYNSLLPIFLAPSWVAGKTGAELALSDYDNAVRLVARLFGDGSTLNLRGMEKYKTAKSFLDRPELSKAVTGLSDALKRAKGTNFQPFAGKLSDVLDLSADPEFAKAYPDFKDINVDISDSGDLGLMGSFSAKDNKLTITKQNIQKHGLTGALRTALHELAHARQNREGAAPGGNDLTHIIDRPPERDLLQAYGERLTKMEDVQANGSWFRKQLYGGPEVLRDRIDAYRTTLAFLDRERTKFDQIAARADRAAGGDKKDRQYYLYRSLAGEVDARNASLRNGLDRKTRSSTLLEDTEDIPRSDQFDARFGVTIGTLDKVGTLLDSHPYILQQDAKGGDAPRPADSSRTPSGHSSARDGRFKMSRNVLATDKVPKTIFGFTIVSERRDYTPEDLRFFRENPEAGGYYDLGDEGGDVVRGDVLGGDSLPDEVKSYYRDPATGRDNVPAAVVKEWEAFRTTHPDAKGYEWNSVEGFREQRDADPGFARHENGDVDAYVKRINAAVTDAIPFIKEHEGFRERAYQDSVGKWTVGYGQTEIDGRPVREGDTITEKDASAFVERRARENAVALYRQNPWMSNLSQGALSALYDVAYNLGTGAISEKRSPILNYEAQSADMDWDSVVWRELPTYVKAGGKVLKGLVDRRNAAMLRWRNL